MIKLKLQEAINYNFYKDKIDKETFDKIVDKDPTKDKKYSRWLVDKYIQNELASSDLIQVIYNYLEKYDNYKKSSLFPQDKKEIQRFKSYQDFIQFMDNNLTNILKGLKKERAYKECQIIEQGENYIFVEPETHASAVFFGQDTDWCTSKEDNTNWFNRYSSTGTLFIYRLIDDNGFPIEANSNDAIQIYIPKEGVEKLAECRDAEDKTIYASHLFNNLDLNKKIIQKIEELWNEKPNTDQWSEGQGYLDPDELHPTDDEEIQIEINHRNLTFDYRFFVDKFAVRFDVINIYDNGDQEQEDYETSFGAISSFKKYMAGKPEVFQEVLDILKTKTSEADIDYYKYIDIPDLMKYGIVMNYTETPVSMRKRLVSTYNIYDIEENRYIYNSPPNTIEGILEYTSEISKVQDIYAILILSEEPIEFNVKNPSDINEFDPLGSIMKYQAENLGHHLPDIRSFGYVNLGYIDNAYVGLYYVNNSLSIKGTKSKKVLDSLPEMLDYIDSVDMYDYLSPEDEIKRGQHMLQFEKQRIQKLLKNLQERKKRNKRHIKVKLGRPSEPGRLFVKDITSIGEPKDS